MPTPTKYTYSIINNTLNGKVNTDTLTTEITTSIIIIALDHIDTNGDILDIWFKDILSLEDQAILNTIISSHTGEIQLNKNPVPITPFKKSSYMTEGGTSNSNGKNMVAIFNPNASGKLTKIWGIWFRCKSNTGNNVLAGYEIRRSSTQSGGTNTDVMKLDTADASASAIVVDGTTTITVTDAGIVQTWVIQTNTAQTPNSYQLEFGGEMKPLILRPNEGLYIKMVTSNNTSAMNIGFAWTEESI